MANRARADFVLDKEKKSRRIKGVVFAFAIICGWELFLSFAMKAYIYQNGYEDISTYLIAFVSAMDTNIFIPSWTWAWVGDCLWFFVKVFSILNLIVLAVMISALRKKGHFKGVEYGSAVWASEEDRDSLCDTGHLIPAAHKLYLNESVRGALGGKKIPHLNEIVIGDTGSNKTFRKIIPDIFQLVGSYVITDTKGALYRQTAKLLTEAGWTVKVLNLYDLSLSNTFNPIQYLTSVDEVQTLVNGFMENTKGENETSTDPFWEQVTTMVLVAVISYLVTADNEDKTFTRVFDLINGLQVGGDGKILSSCELELIMNKLETTDRFHPSVTNYKAFKQSRGNTTTSILSTCMARLQLWANESVRILTNRDEMDIDALANGKTAIFLIVPDNNNAYKVIENMFVSTALSRLTWLADNGYHGRLPNLVSFELDEFGNLGKLTSLETLITTLRSRNIRTMLVIQNMQQLEKLYDKANKTILSNSHLIYLGTSDVDTNEMIVKRLGKATIDENNISRNFGHTGGGSEQDRGLGRELLTASELEVIDGKCVVFIRHFNPFFEDLFHTEEHYMFDKLGIDDDKHPHFENNTYIEDTYADIAHVHKALYEEYKKRRMCEGFTARILPTAKSNDGDGDGGGGDGVEQKKTNKTAEGANVGGVAKKPAPVEPSKQPYQDPPQSPKKYRAMTGEEFEVLSGYERPVQDTRESLKAINNSNK